MTLLFAPPFCSPERYYLADGVKLFSQETWRMFMGEAGREMVGKYAQDVTDYYCMASELDNHCVRESACHSIAEMAEKVRRCSVLSQQSPDTLVQRFR